MFKNIKCTLWNVDDRVTFPAYHSLLKDLFNIELFVYTIGNAITEAIKTPVSILYLFTIYKRKIIYMYIKYEPTYLVTSLSKMSI